jgi:hypothetical protein
MKHLSGATLRYALGLPQNIKLGWKGLPRIKTITYLAYLQVPKKKVL